MLIKRWIKKRNCFEYDLRLYDENGKRKQYKTGLTSKKLAKEYEQKKRNEIAERKLFPERYFEKENSLISLQNTFKNMPHAKDQARTSDYVSISRKLVRFFGDLYLHETTRYHIESYQSERSGQVGVCMVNREITILKGILTKAIDWGFLLKNQLRYKAKRKGPVFVI